MEPKEVVYLGEVPEKIGEIVIYEGHYYRVATKTYISPRIASKLEEEGIMCPVGTLAKCRLAEIWL
jgi:hypothetical protein